MLDGSVSALIPNVGPLLVAAALSWILAVTSWNYRSTPGHRYFSLLLSSIGLWCFFYGLEATFASLPMKTVAASFEYLGIVSVPVFWLLFALSYARVGLFLTKSRLALLFVIPAVVVALVVTNPYHGLIWPSVALDEEGSFRSLVVAHGTIFWIHLAYSYLLLLGGAAALIRAALRYPRSYRAQAFLVMLAALIPWAANLAYVLRLLPDENFDPTPFAFAATGAVLAYAFSRHRLLDLFLGLKPRAKNLIIDTMRDGVIVLDADQRVIDINPAAARFLGVGAKDQAEAVAQSTVRRLLSTSREALKDSFHLEAALSEGPQSRVLDMLVSPIVSDRDGGDGHVVVLRDITERKGAEQALRASEEKSRAILEQFGEGFFLVGEKGLVAEWNQAMERITGLEKREVLGREVWDVLVQVSTKRDELELGYLRDAARETIVEALGGLESSYLFQRIETEIMRPGGERRHVHQMAFPVDTPSGRCIGHIIRDITEPKLMEQSLLLARFSLDHAGDGIVWLDRGGRIFDVNESLCSRLGYVRSELLGRMVYDITVGLDPEVWKERWAELEEHGPLTFQKRYRTKAGHTFPVEITSGTLTHEGNEYIYGLVRDITERRKVEKALRESERRYRTLFESANDMIAIYDLEGRIIDINNVVEERLGYSRDEVVGQKMETLRTRDAAALFPWHLEELKRTGHLVFETTHARKDASSVPVEVSSRLIKQGGRQVVLSISRDITQRKEAERVLREREEQLQQAQKMEAIGQLAGGIAHDFNNLLMAIIGNSSLALSCMDSEDPNRELVADIKEVGERAAVLTKQILAFSRRQVLRPQTVCLNSTVTGLQPLLQRTLGEHIDLRLSLAGDLWPTEVDPGQMEQVLMNLVVNARDAMPRGGCLTIGTKNVVLGEDHCSVHPEVKAGSYVRLTVSDTGQGMDEETKSHIFEPFFTTKEVGKGTGLGLSTVFGVVKQSGGTISVYSEASEGTTFKLYLPAGGVVTVAPAHEDKAEEFVGGAERILVVEDEESVRQLITRVLSQKGYRVTEAASASDLTHIVSDEQPLDLVLTDMILPGGTTGREVAQQLASRYPDLPVIFMSGYPRDTIVHDGRLDEGVEYLEKPFAPGLLLQKIRAVLDERSRLVSLAN